MYKKFRPFAPFCIVVLFCLSGAITLLQLPFDAFQIDLLQRQYQWLLPTISVFAALMLLMSAQPKLQTQLVEKTELPID